MSELPRPLVASVRIFAILADMPREDREHTSAIVAALLALQKAGGDMEAARADLLAVGARSAYALDVAQCFQQRGLFLRGDPHG